MKSKQKAVSRRGRRFIAAGILLAAVLLLSSLFSLRFFSTPNPFAAAYGVARIKLGGAEYVQIRSSPRVVLAAPERSWELFLDTVESEGYRHLEDEQAGAMHILEKDGRREHVLFSGGGHFSKWRWEPAGD